jgi:hypothetical protein
MIYDLETDPAEKKDLAAGQPEIAAKITAFLDTARSENPDWPADRTGKKGKQQP